MKSRLTGLRAMLESTGQGHVLSFYEELTADPREQLLDQIEEQDWKRIAEWVEEYVVNEPKVELPRSIEPAEYYPANPMGALAAKYCEARRVGEALIRSGKVAAFMVAGGQGTRLGWDGPKGTFPATPITGKPLFQVFAEYIIKSQWKYEAAIPWYIMTSPINDGPTRAFFEAHDYFGMKREDVMFFPQGTIPSFGLDGRALLAEKNMLAVNPDGHGGSLRALHQSGAIADMERRGVEQISYFQVDNPLVRCVDPLFIGLHALDSAQMSSKMVTKAHPREKVGAFAMADGKLTVIEYSDLPDELADARNADGSLRFIGGSIAIHVIAVDFVRKLNAGRFGLPYHRAVKKVSHIDVATGHRVEPADPNAVKLETFVFDAIPLADRSVILETVRDDEFGPIKNAEGSDSAVTSRALQSGRAIRWLRGVGVEVEAGAEVEISGLTAIEPGDLKGVRLPRRIGPDEQLSL